MLGRASLLLLLLPVQLSLAFLPPHCRALWFRGSSRLAAPAVPGDALTLDALTEQLQSMSRSLLANPQQSTGYDDNDAHAADPARNKDPRGLPLAELVREALLCARVPGLALDRVELGPAGHGGQPHAGRGLFAGRAVIAGELLTCFPGDALAHAPSGALVWGRHVEARLKEQGDSLACLVDYGTSASPGGTYTVLGSPQLDGDPAYLAHFANDACRWLPPDFYEDFGDLPGDFSDPEAYEAASARGANAALVEVAEGLHMACVALRDLEQGEEVLVSYGAAYWYEHADDGEELADPSLVLCPAFEISK